MKKNVLYIGNALSNKKGTVTTIETLSQHLKAFCSIKVASDKSNKVLRLLDMVNLVIKNRSQADFLMLDTYSTINFYYALIISQLCRILNIKYITILHGGDLENRLKYSPRLSQLLFSNAHRIVAPSNFLKSIFEVYGYNEVIYIPNSIEVENYEFIDRQINTIKLLWVRSFSSLYNPEQAVLVLEALLKLNYDATLTMIGPEVDGALAKTKELAREKKLEVDFTGKLSKSKWRDYAKGCNVFINTTNIDNMPVSVIEAMALGLPIVSTNVGGLPYLIKNEKEGLLVPKQDVEAMVKAILRLRSDEVLKSEIVTNARFKVEKFDWNTIKNKWLAVLS
jgi:glycosyltransferase involved in cell wall biosynthesis